MSNLRYCPKCGSVLIDTVEHINDVLTILQENGHLLGIGPATEETLHDIQLLVIEGLRPLGIYVFTDDPILLEGGLLNSNNKLLEEYIGVSQIKAEHIHQLQEMVNNIENDVIDRYAIFTGLDYWIDEPTTFSSLFMSSSDGRDIYRIVPKHIEELRNAILFYTWQTHADRRTGINEHNVHFWVSYDKYGYPLVYNPEIEYDFPQEDWTNNELSKEVNNENKLVFIKASHIEEMRRNKRGYYEQRQWKSSLNLTTEVDEHDSINWDLTRRKDPTPETGDDFSNPFHKIYSTTTSKNNKVWGFSIEFFHRLNVPAELVYANELPVTTNWFNDENELYKVETSEGYIRGRDTKLEMYARRASNTSNDEETLISGGITHTATSNLLDWAGLKIVLGSKLKLSYLTEGTGFFENLDEDLSEHAYSYITVTISFRSYEDYIEKQIQYYIVKDFTYGVTGTISGINPKAIKIADNENNEEEISLNLYNNLIDNFLGVGVNPNDYYDGTISTSGFMISQIEIKAGLLQQSLWEGGHVYPDMSFDSSVLLNLSSIKIMTSDILDYDLMNSLE